MEAKPLRCEAGVKIPNSVDAASPAFNEKHFSVAELAGLWGFDQSTIRRMFQDVPGVLKFGKDCRRDGKRDYVTLRIPESVAARFHREHLA